MERLQLTMSLEAKVSPYFPLPRAFDCGVVDALATKAWWVRRRSL